MPSRGALTPVATRRAWIILGVLAVLTLLFYVLAFPREPDLDPFDIIREVAFFGAVLTVFWYASRGDLPLLNAGFVLLLWSLWAEVVDEFTMEPRWVGTGVPMPIGILGIAIIAAAARVAARQRELVEQRREQAEEELRKSHSTLRAVVEGTPDAVWVKDLDGRYLMANAACSKVVGWPVVDILGRTDGDLLDSAGASRAAETDRRALAAGETLRYEDSVIVGGGLRTYLISKGVFRDEQGAAVGILGIARDISDRKAAEDALVHRATHDALTGLPNRAEFMERLERALARSRRQPESRFAVLFLDVDRFKEVNDRYGHPAGDELLVVLAGALNHWMRPGDLIARLGGDEFMVLLPDVAGSEDAVHVAERIRLGLRAPLTVNGITIPATVSIGIALSSGGYDRAEVLVKDADAAMYKAKEQGRDRHAIFAA